MTPARYRNLQEVLSTVDAPKQKGRLDFYDHYVAVAETVCGVTCYATAVTVDEAVNKLRRADQPVSFVVNLDNGVAFDVELTVTYTPSDLTFGFTDKRLTAA